MRFYGYNGNYNLGEEKAGTEGRILFEAKSVNSAKKTNAYKVLARKGEFRIYTFSNFYDNKTFKRVF